MVGFPASSGCARPRAPPAGSGGAHACPQGPSPGSRGLLGVGGRGVEPFPSRSPPTAAHGAVRGLRGPTRGPESRVGRSGCGDPPGNRSDGVGGGEIKKAP